MWESTFNCILNLNLKSASVNVHSSLIRFLYSNISAIKLTWFTHIADIKMSTTTFTTVTNTAFNSFCTIWCIIYIADCSQISFTYWDKTQPEHNLKKKLKKIDIINSALYIHICTCRSIITWGIYHRAIFTVH